jgi:hypothetical protein
MSIGEVMTTFIVLILGLVSAFFYVMNIVQLVQEYYTTTVVVFKIMGIFMAPLGVVMGIIG